MRPAAGGIRKHLATLLANLDRNRFEITLFAPADFADFAEEWRVPHIPLRIAPRFSFFKDRAAIRELASHLHGKFDMVHAHGVRGAWIGAQAAKQAVIPCLFTSHNLVPRLNLLARFGLNFVMGLCNPIITVSEAVSQSLQQNGADAAKIHVIPNGVEMVPFDAPFETSKFRAAQNIPQTAPLVVAIGRFSPEKGFDILLRAFPKIQVSVPDARLILVGDGAESKALQKMAAGNPAIIFTGFVENVIPFLKIADVIAIPSRQEGQGIVALEAMAAKKPVVASRVGGLVETIIENETGLLVSPNDSLSLAEALRALLQASERRLRLGEAGYLRVEQHYSAQKMALSLAKLYEVIMNNSPD